MVRIKQSRNPSILRNYLNYIDVTVARLAQDVELLDVFCGKRAMSQQWGQGPNLT